MNIDAIITQIKKYAHVFNGNVAGAAEYALANDTTWLTPPCAFVIPLEDEPDENQVQNGLVQSVKETFGVIVFLDNSTDRRGQSSSTIAVSDVKKSLFSAVLNWKPTDMNVSQGFRYARGGLLGDPNRARLAWQFDFAADVTISWQEGFLPDAVPLNEIDLEFENDSTPVSIEARVTDLQS
ncbi:phage tail terminator protein [Acetobacter oeni]|uniref:Tail protein n=1 Tax=Acetobacter oeni TaxID=304077 RepID=A0A511XP21_9PROT|nr:hypothetical protein [Acetobacter oeni]MBB3884488.1 hypothetical protein [Acetobacter oeni]NHO20420.1 hypothetical protein [Acetobacter oeni]GBR00532.1 bacteriophage protein [Acetobacter oeni LMG 21952]GEN64701.1 hypothetical protein AOE01nite_29250 [Acetobacter oeni]